MIKTMNLKKITFFLIILTALAALFLVTPVQAQFKKNLNIYFFWGEGCPHCEAEKDFLPKLEAKYPGQLAIHDFEVFNNKDNQKILTELFQKLNKQFHGVPVTLVGPYAIEGFDSESGVGQRITQAIDICLVKDCPDYLADTIKNQPTEQPPVVDLPNPENSTSVKYPFLGEINLKSLSLPVLTLVLGTLDGFNPCAMWVLFVLIGLLLNIQSRRKMWLIGSIFILASALTYFVFMVAWLNAIKFIAFFKATKILIGLLAIGAGFWFLKQYLTEKPGECNVTNADQKRKITTKLQNLIKPTVVPATILGLIALAFSVNLIEIFCSLGLPAVYTQILTLNNLPTWQYYLYIAGYILLYMIDDIIIFVIATVTLQHVNSSAKYSHYSKLIGGILIIALGFILILKPELLAFK